MCLVRVEKRTQLFSAVAFKPYIIFVSVNAKRNIRYNRVRIKRPGRALWRSSGFGVS